MPLRDWMHRYPGVKRLLEQPGTCSKGYLGAPQRCPAMSIQWKRALAR